MTWGYPRGIMGAYPGSNLVVDISGDRDKRRTDAQRQVLLDGGCPLVHRVGEELGTHSDEGPGRLPLPSFLIDKLSLGCLLNAK